MAAHPQVFSNLTVSMVRAGLEGAFLEDALERVAMFLRRQNELRARVMSALTYPIIPGCSWLRRDGGVDLVYCPAIRRFFSNGWSEVAVACRGSPS